MPAVRGSKVVVGRGDGGDPTEAFTAIGFLQNANLTLDGSTIDVTTFDDVDGNDEIWRTKITGVKELSLSGRGIAKAIEPLQSVYDDFAAGGIVNYQIFIPYLGTFTVAMIVANMNFDGPHDGVLSFELSLESAGAPSFVAAT